LADITAVVHISWWAFVVLGPIFVWKSRRGRIFHAVILWLSAATLTFYCPLSAVEVVFRQNFNPASAYSGGFLHHYLAILGGWNPNMTCVKSVGAFWAVLWTIIYLLTPLRVPAEPPSTR
jgi:hypothetical protein